MDVVIERLLHEESKTKDGTGDVNSENAMLQNIDNVVQ